MLNKIIRSRTVWVITFTFVLAGFEGVRDFIPVVFQTPVFGLLGLLAAWFKLNPSQDYSK